MLKKHYFLLFFLTLNLLFPFFNSSVVFAQYVYSSQDMREDITLFETLPDKNYTFEQVLHDKSLIFKKHPQNLKSQKIYNFKGLTHYWVRFSTYNPTHQSQAVRFWTFPFFDNVFYYYDYDTKKWENKQTGMKTPILERSYGGINAVLYAQKQDTFYLKIKVESLSTQNIATVIDISIEKKSKYDAYEQYRHTAWVSTMVVILMFFLYNLYIYFIFKDHTYLYYLVILVGGMLYVTSIGRFLNLFFRNNIFYVYLSPKGNVYSAGVSDFMVNIAILVVIGGFIQFTRHYLNSKMVLPFWDKCLRYLYFGLLGMFITIDITIITINKLFYVGLKTIDVSNALVAIIILLMFYMAFITYKKGYLVGKYFLIANTLPLLMMLVLALYFFYNSTQTAIHAFALPNLAIMTQALTFAVALVARVNFLKEELKEKQLEASTLQAENEQITARNQFIALENEYILAEIALEKHEKQSLQEKIEANEQRIEANEREMTSNTMYLYQKNEMLANLQKQIQNLSQNDNSKNHETIKEIKSTLQNDLNLTSDWDKFKIHFEKIHPNFFKDLEKNYDTLTTNEIRLCAYFHLKLSIKEIATLLNINPDSVRKAKTRLNKKLKSEHK